MKVDVFPNATDSLPHASFLRRRGDDAAARIRRLHQTNVSDHGSIAHDANIGAADRNRWLFARSGRGPRGVGKVGAVERQTLDQMSAALGLNRRNIVRTDFGVSRPVTTENRGQQFFGSGKDFSGGRAGLRHLRVERGWGGVAQWFVEHETGDA